MQNHSDDITELAKALISVQKDLSPAVKDGANPFTKSSYATLNSVMESCRAALLKHGIWLTQLPVPAPLELGGGYIALETKLTHAESGQWQSSLTVAPLPKNDPQGMGSALTYCRRYALTAMLGMVTEDDDGEGAKKAPERKPKGTRPAEGQPKQPPKGTPAHNGPDLPKIDGVTFQTNTAADGQKFIVALGNTQPKKDILAGLGFKWNTQRQTWWKFAA